MTHPSRVLNCSIVLAAFTIGGCARKGAIEEQGPVPLEKIHRAGIEGRLGVRMGTIIKVAGEVVENPAYQMKALESEHAVLLRITHVNDRALTTPVEYPFTKANRWAKAPQPVLGQEFRYVGYETGSFRGSPPGEFEYVPPYQTVGYFFYTKFSVLAAE